MMTVFASVDHLASIHNVPVVDEQMLHAYLEHSGLLNRTRLIATSHFEPTLTRDGTTWVPAYDGQSAREQPIVTLPLQTTGQYPFRDT